MEGRNGFHIWHHRFAVGSMHHTPRDLDLDVVSVVDTLKPNGIQSSHIFAS
jgi:hypothetical protein